MVPLWEKFRAMMPPSSQAMNPTVLSEILTPRAFPPHSIKTAFLLEIISGNNFPPVRLQLLSLHSWISRVMKAYGMTCYNDATSPNSALLQQSGDEGWMDLVNIPQEDPSDFFGVGQQFDAIPSNYGDQAGISGSPTLVGDDDVLFRRIFQTAGIVDAAAIWDAGMPTIQSPLPAYLPAQAMPVAYPTENSLAPTVDTYAAHLANDSLPGCSIN
jgi:hypothetical protein